MTEFLKKHSVLCIGIMIYLIVYLASCVYDPWLEHGFSVQWEYFLHPENFHDASDYTKRVLGQELAEGNSQVMQYGIPTVLQENPIAQKFPPSFFYFPMVELAAGIKNGMIVGFVVFTFAFLIVEYLIQPLAEYTGVTGKLERGLIGYIYNMAVLYLCSCFIRPLEQWAKSFVSFSWALDLNEIPRNAATMVGVALYAIGVILLMLAFLFLLLLPAAANGMFFIFIYHTAFTLGMTLIQGIDQGILQNIWSAPSFGYDLTVFLIAVLIMFLLHFLLERLLTLVQHIVSKPLVLTGCGIRRIGESIQQRLS